MGIGGETRQDRPWPALTPPARNELGSRDVTPKPSPIRQAAIRRPTIGRQTPGTVLQKSEGRRGGLCRRRTQRPTRLVWIRQPHLRGRFLQDLIEPGRRAMSAVALAGELAGDRRFALLAPVAGNDLILERVNDSVQFPALVGHLGLNLPYLIQGLYNVLV